MKRPNTWSLGDKATVRVANSQVPVTITAFIGELVEIRYENGNKGRRPFSAPKQTHA
jgi:hypothetical protein